MVLGIGTDIVSVQRLRKWEQYSYDQLRKTFSKSELEYCKTDNGYDWISLAARFAAKEAFYKAISAALVTLGKTSSEFSFLFMCKSVYVDKGVWDLPFLCINWKELGIDIGDVSVKLSISHEMDFAIAFVIISRE